MSDAADERRTSYVVHRIPRSHWHCHLDNFDYARVSPRGLEKAINQFVGGMLDGTAPHLILCGEPGRGKSHLGVALYRAGVFAFGTGGATWLNVPDFCDHVKRSYGQEYDPWEDIETARDLVVLDDLFGRDLSTHEVSQIVYRLIDTAYTRGAAVVVTMHQAVEEITSRLASHEVSRLLANARIANISAPNDGRR